MPDTPWDEIREAIRYAEEHGHWAIDWKPAYAALTALTALTTELAAKDRALREIALLLSAPPKSATAEQRLEAAVKTARMALSPTEEPTKHSHDVLLPAQPCPICDDPWHGEEP